MIPLVYISSTLPLAHHGVENRITNSLSVGFLLSTLGVALMVVAARMEASSPEILDLRNVQKQRMAEERMEVKNTDKKTIADQSDSTLKGHNASIYQERSSSSRTQISLVYSDSDSETPTLPFVRMSTFQAASEPGSAELLATKNELAELQAELHGIQHELAELKAELCATQYVSQLFFLLEINIPKKCRRNTKTALAEHPSRGSKHDKRTQQFKTLFCRQKITIFTTFEAGADSECSIWCLLTISHGATSTSSGVQRSKDVSYTPLSQSRHVTSEGLQLSHQCEEHSFASFFSWQLGSMFFQQHWFTTSHTTGLTQRQRGENL